MVYFLNQYYEFIAALRNDERGIRHLLCQISIWSIYQFPDDFLLSPSGFLRSKFEKYRTCIEQTSKIVRRNVEKEQPED